MPLIIALLLEWIMLSWTARVISKSAPRPNQSDRRFYWSIIRRMSLRLLILAVFPMPEIVAVLCLFGNNRPEQTAEAVFWVAMIPVMLSPLLILSIMWRAKKLVKQQILFLSSGRPASVSQFGSESIHEDANICPYCRQTLPQQPIEASTPPDTSSHQKLVEIAQVMDEHASKPLQERGIGH